MGISAVFPKVALALFFKKLAHLRLIVVVGYFEELELDFNGQFIVTASQLSLTVREMARITLNAVHLLHEVLA